MRIVLFQINCGDALYAVEAKSREHAFIPYRLYCLLCLDLSIPSEIVYLYGVGSFEHELHSFHDRLSLAPDRKRAALSGSLCWGRTREEKKGAT